MKKSPSTSKSSEMSGKRNLVMRVYLYIFMGIGLVMVSIGAFGLGQNVYKSALFPKYPLESYNESRCDYLDHGSYPADPAFIGKGESEVDTKMLIEQNKQQAEKCRTSLEEERKIKKITDFYNSLILLGIGSALFVGHLLVNVKTNNR